MYIVVIPKRVEKELIELESVIRRSVINVLMALRENPYISGTKRLKWNLCGLYRIRVGKYRIIYEILNIEKRVIVLKIGPRKDIYRT